MPRRLKLDARLGLAALLAATPPFAAKALADDAAPVADTLSAISSAPPAVPSSASNSIPISPVVSGLSSGPNAATGLPIGGFLVYPQIFLGGIYNDNLYTAETDRVGGLGFEITPSIFAIDDQGVHKTTLSLNADATIYGASHASPTTGQSPTNVSGSATLDHTWKPEGDLTIDVIAGFIRQSGAFGTFGATGTNFVTESTLATSAASQQYWNEVTGALVVDKEFGDLWYLRGGFGVQDITYEPPPPGSPILLQSGVNYNGFVRGGYRVAAPFSVFVEVDGNAARYQNEWYNTNASRVVGGISSDQVGLFRGEVYAGYQWENSTNDNFGSVTAPAYGATVFYYPTRYLTLEATLQNGFGSAALYGLTPSFGAPSGDTVEGRFQADYALSPIWTASVRAGWARTTWSGRSLEETAWTFGGSLSYNYWRNLSVTLNYQYTGATASQTTAVSYTQNLVSAGLTYRY